jgi:2,3-bisphosphoglycerate-independent phosphoglycerate mutase
MEVIDMKHTGSLREDYRTLAEDIVRAVMHFDVLVVHVKGPDEAGHDGDFLKKKEIIELIDKYLVNNLLASIESREIIFCITSDHATPCNAMVHSDDPVPILISGNGVPKDKVIFFNESTCKNGDLKLQNGREVLPFLVKMIRGI